MARRLCALWLMGMMVLAAAALLQEGAGEPGTQTALRWTARCALMLFALTFVASPLYTLWPGRLTGRLRDHRQLLGVSFGLSMSIHLALILWLYWVSNFAPAEVRPVDLVIGGSGLLLIGAMLVTSLGRIRMAMPAPWWKRLHRGGLYFVWFVFFACLSTSMVEKSTELLPLRYVLFLALLLGILVLRVAAAWRVRGGLAPN
jgi:sulfoxide reductase heme-binding subunit YedZ